MIEIKNVSFRYNYEREQLSGISLTVRQGEFVVLTGPSGCGKTTLTRLFNGLIPHFYEGTLSGEVYVGGKNAADLQPWEFGKLVGSVFQDPRSQFFAAVVKDEIAFGCENYGILSNEIQIRMKEAARALQIEPLLARHLLTLSSGEKQKVAVASVQAAKPTIYVMDEPSANLDMAATKELMEVLKKLKAAGSTVIIAEHRLYYLMELADRVVYMKNGKIECSYTSRQMKSLSKDRLSEMGLRTTTLSWDVNKIITGLTGEEPVLRVQNLAVKAGKSSGLLLLDVSFCIKPGEILALTGPNGVGKTTLARVLCGLVKEKSGKILYNGTGVKASRRCRHAWFVMQDTDSQLFSESVLGEMTLGKKLESTLLEKAEEILNELDLWEYRERHPASLSGGQKQRLTLAVALMQQTPVLILDEPTSGLDGRNLERVVQCVKAQAASGKAVLIITHDHELVQKVCTRIVYLQKGMLFKDFCLHADSYPLAVDCMLGIV
ncbi:ABC transporter related [Desulfofarcimen acetoxidans DSM 771]|uniref:ABC transporter related n=1 Tax=Desulfofarcimen acetoxidans (strain ATCC 49208 / DSM 771 / KCTC 5769 / VKM B-1644 / 5575) TaxID=485916 RepID=C8W139_DESAS|nr:energy-coupling factor ABC transporter ATP-binding protein [Desulfofarcimen acetoxidans]ACV63435.1 ABC transporter related [Desulfofarcimen acetoxidans DSM 771]